jgi:importin-9
MEDQLVQILANTHSAAEGPRKQAELDLKHARTNPAFPISLANIGSHASVTLEIRQSALSSLRQFIERNWTGESDEGPVIPISDQVKEQVRSVVLEIALSSDEERKIKTAARYVGNKVRSHICLRPCFRGPV